MKKQKAKVDRKQLKRRVLGYSAAAGAALAVAGTPEDVSANVIVGSRDLGFTQKTISSGGNYAINFANPYGSLTPQLGFNLANWPPALYPSGPPSNNSSMRRLGPVAAGGAYAAGNRAFLSNIQPARLNPQAKINAARFAGAVGGGKLASHRQAVDFHGVVNNWPSFTSYGYYYNWHSSRRWDRIGSTPGVAAGNFATRGYLPIKVNLEDASHATQAHFGWVDVGVNSTGTQLKIYDYAYEGTPNTEILAGATVPEPGSLALLALGAAGLLAWRASRKIAAKTPGA